MSDLRLLAAGNSKYIQSGGVIGKIKDCQIENWSIVRKDEAPDIVDKLINTLLGSNISFGERKGAAYGIAGETLWWTPLLIDFEVLHNDHYLWF